MANAERNENYTISESYTLPSGGVIYDPPVNPHIELRSMTTREELKRLNPSSTPLKTLADIIEDCMLEKPAVHVYDMAVGDYEYLLHKLRTVTYGPSYKVSVTCANCGATIDTTAQLDQLVVKPFDMKEFDQLRTIILPVSKHEITLKVQTPRDLDAIDIKVKDMRKKAPNAGINFETFAQLLSYVDFVDGTKLNSVELESFIGALPARDMNKLVNAAEKLNAYIGLDSKLSFICSTCGEEINTFFRFGPEFFRPTDDE